MTHTDNNEKPETTVVIGFAQIAHVMKARGEYSALELCINHMPMFVINSNRVRNS